MRHSHRRNFRHASLETVITAAQAVPGDDTPAMKEIIVRFEPLAKKLANRMTLDVHLRDDLINSARHAVVRAVRKHDPGKPGFASFVERYMRGAIFREMQKLVPPAVESMDDKATEIVSTENGIEKVEDGLAPFGGGSVAAAAMGLRPEQQRLVVMRYVDDLTMPEIAAEVGASVPAVSQRFSTIHRAVKRSIAA